MAQRARATAGLLPGHSTKCRPAPPQGPADQHMPGPGARVTTAPATSLLACRRRAGDQGPQRLTTDPRPCPRLPSPSRPASPGCDTKNTTASRAPRAGVMLAVAGSGAVEVECVGAVVDEKQSLAVGEGGHAEEVAGPVRSGSRAGPAPCSASPSPPPSRRLLRQRRRQRPPLPALITERSCHSGARARDPSLCAASATSVFPTRARRAEHSVAMIKDAGAAAELQPH